MFQRDPQTGLLRSGVGTGSPPCSGFLLVWPGGPRASGWRGFQAPRGRGVGGEAAWGGFPPAHPHPPGRVAVGSPPPVTCFPSSRGRPPVRPPPPGHWSPTDSPQKGLAVGDKERSAGWAWQSAAHLASPGFQGLSHPFLSLLPRPPWGLRYHVCEMGLEERPPWASLTWAPWESPCGTPPSPWRPPSCPLAHPQPRTPQGRQGFSPLPSPRGPSTSQAYRHTVGA